MGNDAFNLSQLIGDVSESCSETDPHRISSLILDKIADEDLREALGQALPSLVSDHLRHDRRTTRTAANADPKRSRWGGIGQIYTKFLNDRVSVNGDWKFVGHCTHDDVLVLIGERLSQAKALGTEAKRFELLAKAMKATKAATVADLDEATILEVLRWQP